MKEVERSFLSKNEIITIYLKDFSLIQLVQVKDAFIFYYFKGLAYIDVFEPEKSNIEIGIDGGRWIFSYRQKIDTPTTTCCKGT